MSTAVGEIACVHYTKRPHWELHPIRIKNFDGGFPKPEGALWTTPLDSTESWAAWCKDNHFRVGELQHRVLLQVRRETCLVIDSLRDSLEKLPWRLVEGSERWPLYRIDFESLLAAGWQSVWLTVPGLIDAAMSLSVMPGKPGSLYGWDCETVMIMSEEAITEWRRLS